MTETTHCKNCETTLQGTFCHQCGQKLIEGRLTLRGIFSNILAAVINLERGFLHTVKMLFINPGKLIRDIWNRVTMPYYPAFRYVLVWATLAVIVNVGLGIFDSQQAEMTETFGIGQNEKTAANQQEIMEFTKKYMSLVMLLIIPFLSIASRWFFKKEKLNYAEHLVMNTYFMGQQAFIGLPLMLIMARITLLSKYFIPMGILINGLYLAYAYKSTFHLSNWQATWKGILTYITGYLLYMLAIMLVTLVVLIGYFIVVKVFY